MAQRTLQRSLANPPRPNASVDVLNTMLLRGLQLALKNLPCGPATYADNFLPLCNTADGLDVAMLHLQKAGTAIDKMWDAPIVDPATGKPSVDLRDESRILAEEFAMKHAVRPVAQEQCAVQHDFLPGESRQRRYELQFLLTTKAPDNDGIPPRLLHHLLPILRR